MHRSEVEPSKATLHDLLTAIGFCIPVIGGLMEGWRHGFIATVLGGGLGFILGIAVAGMLRFGVARAIGYCERIETRLSFAWQVTAGIWLLLAELMWIFVAGGVAFWIIRVLLRRAAG